MNKNKKKSNKWEIQRFIRVDEYLTVKYLTVTVNANNSPLVNTYICISDLMSGSYDKRTDFLITVDVEKILFHS